MSRTGVKNNNPRLAAAIENWPAWAAEKPQVIRQLPGGLTNESWLVQAGNSHYVLRLNAANSGALGIDREQESAAMAQAASAGLAPQVIHNDLASGILIREFLPGKSLHPKEFCSIDNIHQLVRLLKSVHRLNIAGNPLDLQNKAAHYLQHIDEKSSYGKQLKKLQPRIQHSIHEAQTLNPQPCLCHNDLLASNLILTANKQLKAIDWEYAAMGDPFFELAVIVEGNQLDETTARILLAAYVGFDDEIVYKAMDISAAISRLALCRVIYHYIDLLWYAVQLNSMQINNIPTREAEKVLINKLEHCQGL